MTDKQLKLWFVKGMALLFLGVVAGIIFTFIIYNCVDCPPNLLGWFLGIAFCLTLFFAGISIGMESDDDD